MLRARAWPSSAITRDGMSNLLTMNEIGVISKIKRDVGWRQSLALATRRHIVSRRHSVSSWRTPAQYAEVESYGTGKAGITSGFGRPYRS
jgi:hypothetical protein